MNFSRVISAPTALLLSLACSDPPSPPPEAAVVIRIGGGNGCAVSGTSSHSIPGDIGVEAALNCNPAVKGCEPDKFVAVDRASGATVSCSVKSSADGYSVDLSAGVNLQMTFSASGTISGGTGTFAITEKDLENSGLSDQACTVTARSIKGGAILATYSCSNFKSRSDPNATGCTATGAFLFQNCND